MIHRINNLKELQAEKKRIDEHRKALEGAIKNSWHEFRRSLSPVNVAKELWRKILHR